MCASCVVMFAWTGSSPLELETETRFSRFSDTACKMLRFCFQFNCPSCSYNDLGNRRFIRAKVRPSCHKRYARFNEFELFPTWFLTNHHGAEPPPILHVCISYYVDNATIIEKGIQAQLRAEEPTYEIQTCILKDLANKRHTLPGLG